MSERPPIPERISSLMAAPTRARLSAIQTRKVSAMSALSSCSGVSEFLEQKIEQLSHGVELQDEYLLGLEAALKAGDLSQDQFEKESSLAVAAKTTEMRELVVAKRQRKLIEEDMEEEQRLLGRLEDAYSQSMVNRVAQASAKLSKSKFNVSKFRKAVGQYYDAVRYNQEGKKAWCCATGQWWLSDDTTAAYIVPKSLQSGELSYLFGVGEAMLAEPRNGLPVHKKLEVALDTGMIVIVPVATAQEPQTRWKMLLTDPRKANLIALGGFDLHLYWRDLDGRELQFRGMKRPARRYLYFRYIMTYLICKQQGLPMEWTQKANTTKNAMWATPGPYLRKSMLVALARKVSHHYLPDVLVETTTFTDQPDSPPRPNEEETLAEALALSIHDTHQAAVTKRDRDPDEDEDEDEDKDDDEDDGDETKKEEQGEKE